MPFHKYLLDSDVAKVMCIYGLIDDLAIALGITLADFLVLSQLKFQLKLNSPAKAFQKLGSEAAVQHAKRLVAEASEVTALTESANYALLSATPDIDGGELALFAALCEDPQAGLVTGDKRALVALCQVSGDIEGKFAWAQILCLEEAVAALLAHFGLKYVSARIRAYPGTNIALEIVFGRSQPHDLANVNAGLESYLKHLMHDTQGKYVSPFLASLSP